MRRLLLVFALAALCAAVTTPAFGATRNVDLKGVDFRPGSVTIKKNSSIRFRWRGGPHNVKKVRGPGRFGTIGVRRRGTVTRKFTRAGRYQFICTLHPGMRLQLRVRR